MYFWVVATECPTSLPAVYQETAGSNIYLTTTFLHYFVCMRSMYIRTWFTLHSIMCFCGGGGRWRRVSVLQINQGSVLGRCVLCTVCCDVRNVAVELTTAKTLGCETPDIHMRDIPPGKQRYQSVKTSNNEKKDRHYLSVMLLWRKNCIFLT